MVSEAPTTSATDKFEHGLKTAKLIRERAITSTHPLYVREGQPIPEVVDPQRVIFIKREYVDPPQRGEEFLPEVSEEAAANLFGADNRRPERFGRLLNLPADGIA